MSSSKFSRRKFLGTFAVLGSITFIPGSLFQEAFAAKESEPIPDLVSVKSKDFYKATLEAVNGIGGMQRFVKPNSRVGILLNNGFKNRGTNTNPDIALATIKMCFEAGAAEVILIKPASESYWRTSSYFESHVHYIEMLKVNEGHTKVAIPRGIILKEAEVINGITTYDTFINIPIAKHHGAAMLTNALKNLMGLCTGVTNRGFHNATGEGQETDSDRLAQCIADINTLRKPDLCIVDATEFILTNGPFGPGEIGEELKVIAGTDPVAIDAYCAQFHGLAVTDIKTIGFAEQQGLGTSDLSKLIIKEIELV